MKQQHISKSKLIKVEAQSLKIHPTAQRSLIPSKLKELMNDLDLDAIGVLHAVEYEIDGVKGIWIIDGQHRWRALMDHGLGEWIVEVKIHLDVQDEARACALFLKLNNRRAVGPYDNFDKARRAGIPDAVGVARITDSQHLKISKNSGGDGYIRCVTVMRMIFGYDGGKALTATLDTLLSAWGRNEAAVDGRIVEGVGLLFKTFNGSIERPVMVKKLSKYPGGPSGVLGDARGLRQYRHLSVARCVAERVIEVYNVGRKTGKLEQLEQ